MMDINTHFLVGEYTSQNNPSLSDLSGLMLKRKIWNSSKWKFWEAKFLMPLHTKKLALIATDFMEEYWLLFTSTSLRFWDNSQITLASASQFITKVLLKCSYLSVSINFFFSQIL